MWKRRLLWFVIWVLSLVAISCYGGAVSYGLMFAVMLMPCVSLFYLTVLYFRFKVYQSIESRNVVCGQPISYYFVLQNDDRFSFAGVRARMYSDFSTVENLDESMEYQILPGESFRYETKLICRYRGEYAVGVKECVVTDFFRLFSVKYHMNDRIQIIALPRVVKLKQLKGLDDNNALLLREVPNPPILPDITVRSYLPGDSLKQIHWKVTAREQKLMVREKMGEEKQGISIFLDTKRYSRAKAKYLPLENKMLELMLALAFFFAEKQIPFSLYYGQKGVRKERVTSFGGFDAFYHRTSDIIFSQEEEPDRTILEILKEPVPDRIIFLVVHEIQDTYLAFKKQMLLNNTTVFIYVVSDDTPADDARYEDYGKSLLFVGEEADLLEVL